jgi:general L-amino acid transport system permease protein
LNLSNVVNISNKGIELFGLNLSSEFSALLFGLSIFSSAFIAEVIRGGIQSVPVGQWEAFRSLGISEKQGFIKIIIPQALPAFIPGLTSQYLNLAKNSTLARAVECFIILLCSFLILNLLITKVMGIIDKSIMKTRI